MNNEPRYVRGAFLAYPPQVRFSPREAPQVIPFLFNPESLSRSLSLGGQNPPPKTAEPNASLDTNKTPGQATTSNDASASELKHSFSLKLRFDLHERDQAFRLLPPALGIAPELAVLEMLMHTVHEGFISIKAGVTRRSERQLVLLVWGPRVLPVRVASMQIDETVHNAFLNPVRAEVSVSLEVLSGDHDNALVKGVHTYMRLKRESLARLFHATAAVQGGGILPL
jgi:hypothetical protein